MTKERFKDICIVALFLIILFGIFKTCTKEPKPYVPLDLKPEIKAQDSLKGKVDSLNKASKILQEKAIKADSVANHYLGRYKFYKAKFLNQKDSTPQGKEILFITQSCDSLIAQDSIRDLAWKKVHQNDSIEISSYKNLRCVDSIIQKKQAKRIESDSTTIAKLNRKLKWQKRFTKGAFLLGVATGGFVGVKIGN